MPTPEELQKDFEDFIEKKYGGSVSVFSHVERPSFGGPSRPKSDPSAETTPQFDLNFNLRPKDVKAYLDRFVIKQDEAKKALAIAVCDHYNFVKESLQDPEISKRNFSKQNVLLMGPTGVGKTYLIRLIADLLGVPFVKADATRFTETGYVGANVDDLIRDLVNQAKGDIELAQYGIVYLDEADKLATAHQMVGRDVSGRGVQIGLLKLMEETEVDLRATHDMASQIRALMEFQQKGKIEKQVVNTKHILFIVSGAFSNLKDIIRRRVGHTAIGLGTEKKSREEDDLFPLVATEDLVNFGFEPEFVGRLPIRVTCLNLNEEDLFYILKNAEGSLIKQYELAFKAYGIQVHFSDEGLMEIAKKAHLEKTGARALMTVCEKTLRDLKFELPSSQIPEFVVTADLVNDPKGELQRILLEEGHNRKIVLQHRIRKFEDSFRERYHVNIHFDEGARELIDQKAQLENTSPEKICESLFEGQEYGLKLIKQNAPGQEYIFTKTGVEHPQQQLEDWVKEAYKRENLH